MPTLSGPLKPVRGKVREVDYDYLLRDLCGGEHGLQTEIISTLFTAFTEIIRQLHLDPYATNHNTPDRVRRILSSIPHIWSRSFLARTTDSDVNKPAFK